MEVLGKDQNLHLLGEASGFGFLTNSCDLALSDRPLPPRNITVSDIKADSCYLTWDAPEDNGGSEITNYIVERRDASKKKSDFDVLTINLIDRRYGVRLCH